jgi:hypothetical protein
VLYAKVIVLAVYENHIIKVVVNGVVDKNIKVNIVNTPTSIVNKSCSADMVYRSTIKILAQKNKKATVLINITGDIKEIPHTNISCDNTLFILKCILFSVVLTKERGDHSDTTYDDVSNINT